MEYDWRIKRTFNKILDSFRSYLICLLYELIFVEWPTLNLRFLVTNHDVSRISLIASIRLSPSMSLI